MSKLWWHNPLVWLVVVRLAVASTYSLVTPVWEAYDEDGHFAYVAYVARHRSLLKADDPEAAQIWEKFQPPLYYCLTAPIVALLDRGGVWKIPERNPYFAYGVAGVNYAIRPEILDPETERTVLAVLAIRLQGVLFSTVSVIFVYVAARRLWRTQPRLALTATCLYAFWPQYLFVGGMVTNDLLVTALASVGICAALVLVTDGFNWRYAATLIVALGLATVTKINALALFPMAVLAFGLSWRRDWRSFWRTQWPALLALIVILAIAIWWLSSLTFVREHVFQAVTIRRFWKNLIFLLSQSNIPLHGFVAEALAYGFRTFLASFGWGNLEAYPWLYELWGGGVALAAIGWGWAIFKRQLCLPRGVPLLLVIQPMCLLAVALALAVAYRTIHLVPGRYLLPALPIVCLLLVAGWQALVPPGWQRYVWRLIALVVVLVGWSIPLMVLAPAYAKPRPLSAAERVAMRPLSVVFGGEIALLGYLPPPVAEPGKELALKLCWQALVPVGGNYPVVLQIVGPDGQGYGRLETYPGRGNYATSLWAVHRPFCDQYRLEVRADIPAPAAAHVEVQLLSAVDGKPLTVNDPAGVRIAIKVSSGRPQLLSALQPVEYRFGGEIVLRGYAWVSLPAYRRGVLVSLLWEAQRDISANYIVFVHLRDTAGGIYAQDDSRPRRGWYPTWLWETGEIILDEHPLNFSAEMPASSLDFVVGIYDADTGARLPVEDAQGAPLPNDEVILARQVQEW